MTTTDTPKTRTITMTDRRPVKIREDEWPVEAEASFSDHDNQYRFQANRTWDGWLKVRKHADGRRLVYAGYDFHTQYQHERDARVRAGVLLDASATTEDVVRAIHEVNAIRQEWCPTDLAAECIADLPAEAI